jgi:hypothetical protein
MSSREECSCANLRGRPIGSIIVSGFFTVTVNCSTVFSTRSVLMNNGRGSCEFASRKSSLTIVVNDRPSCCSE